MFDSILTIALGAILINNFIFSQFLGCCPFLGCSTKIDTAIGMGIAVTFVMGLASAICYAVNLLLIALDLSYMSTLAFILVIAALVQFVEIFLKKYVPPLYKSLGVYLPLITTNCAVLAVTLLNVSNGYTTPGTSGGLLLSCVNGFSAGVGFGLALILFCGVRKALEHAKPPKCFEGLPITLVAAALTSMTFMGFAGMADKLFGA